jgi:hypothetical protein
VEKAGEPWIAAQGRLVSNYDAGSPGSSVGYITVNLKRNVCWSTYPQLKKKKKITGKNAVSVRRTDEK